MAKKWKFRRSSVTPPPDPTSGSDLEFLAAVLAAESYGTLSTTGITDALANTGGSSNSLIPYAVSMQWDSIRRRAHFIGTDHGAPNGSVLPYHVWLDALTGEWTLPITPAWATTSLPTGYDDAHGYHGTAINVVGRKLYRAPYNRPDVHVFDLDTDDTTNIANWDELPSNGLGNYIITAIEFFPERNELVYVSGGSTNLKIFSETSQTWSDITPVGWGVTGTWTFAIYNNVLKEVLLGASIASDLTELWVYDESGTLTQKADAASTYRTYDGSGYTGIWTVDPVSGLYLVLTDPSNGTGRNLYTYNSATDTFASAPVQLPAKHLFGSYTAFTVPASGVVVFVWTTSGGSAAQGVYLYKHQQPVGGFVMPTMRDEIETYAKFGWTWTSGQKPSAISEVVSPYEVEDIDIHGDTEGDDLWTYIQMFRRSGNSLYGDRALSATGWARYFKEDYLACVGGEFADYCFDRSGYGGDHLYGWGLMALYEHNGDAAALTAADDIALELADLHSAETPFGCLITHACLAYGNRHIGRHLHIAARYKQLTGDGAVLTTVMGHFLSGTAQDYWDATYGFYAVGDFTTDAVVGTGEHAAGTRINSAQGMGILTEGMFQAYRATGDATLRAQLIARAEFVQAYGLDPVYQYPGSSFGVRGGQSYHTYAHYEYLNSTFKIKSDGADTRQITLHGYNSSYTPITEQLTLNGTTLVTGSTTFYRLTKITGASDGSRTVSVWMPDGTTQVVRAFATNFVLAPSATESKIVLFWDPVYATALVNTLVVGYKLTGDASLLDSAKVFFNRGTKGIYGDPVGRDSTDTEVDHFVDTEFSSASGYYFFDNNKGELLYTYLLFENGGYPIRVE